MFKNWKIFETMLKVNLFMQILIFLGYFMFIDYEQYLQKNHDWWYYIDSALLFIYFICTRLGFLAVFYLVYLFFYYIDRQNLKIKQQISKSILLIYS